MKDAVQHKELDPSSLLSQLIKTSIEKFNNTQIDEHDTEKFGYTSYYHLSQAAEDAVKDLIAETEMTSGEIASIITQDTAVNPQEIVIFQDVVSQVDTWEELSISITRLIIEKEIETRYPNLDAENLRRVELTSENGLQYADQK